MRCVPGTPRVGSEVEKTVTSPHLCPNPLRGKDQEVTVEPSPNRDQPSLTPLNRHPEPPMVAPARRHRARRRSFRRQFRRPARPTVAMVGRVDLGTPDRPDPVPMVLVLDGDHLEQMEADRLIASTGLKAWVRPVRADDSPDVSRAIDPTPEALETAEEFGARMGAASHVLVTAISAGIRTRVPLTVLPSVMLN